MIYQERGCRADVTQIGHRIDTVSHISSDIIQIEHHKDKVAQCRDRI